METKTVPFKQDIDLHSALEFKILRVCPSGKQDNVKLKTLHFHNILEIDYIIGGEGINIFDDNAYNIQPDDIYIINPFENHSAYSYGTLELVCIHFNPYGIISNVLNDSNLTETMNTKNLTFLNLLRGNEAETEKLRLTIQEILKEWEEKSEGYRTIIRLLLGKLLLLLNRNFRLGLSVNTIQERNHFMYDRVREILNFVHDHYQEQISLDELSSKVHMHKNSLCSFFKKATGFTLFSYITKLRINNACNLLMTTDMNIKQISSACGFKSMSNFDKVFHKLLFMSPNDYRKKPSP